MTLEILISPSLLFLFALVILRLQKLGLLTFYPAALRYSPFGLRYSGSSSLRSSWRCRLFFIGHGKKTFWAIMVSQLRIEFFRFVYHSYCKNNRCHV